MRKETITKLKKKGWSEEDINKTQKIISEGAVLDKSKTQPFVNVVVFWTVVLVMVIGNFIISLLLIPFLLIINKIALDVVVVILGLAFGSLFNLLMTDLKYIERKHYILGGLLIPVLALVNISAMVKVAEAMNEVLRVGIVREDPIFVSSLYAIAFILPYLYTVFVSKKIIIPYKEKGIFKEKEIQKEFEKKY